MITAPNGSVLTTRGWQTEAALRMLHDSLDPALADNPEELVLHGGTGPSAPDWPSYQAIAARLADLRLDETLLVQGGQLAGVIATNEWAPRVLIVESGFGGESGGDEPGGNDAVSEDGNRRDDQLGLRLCGQLNASSWAGTDAQAILHATYQTFAAVATRLATGTTSDQRGTSAATLAGTITLTAGLGGMGGAQPLAVTMNGGVAICIDADPAQLARRITQGYLDVQVSSMAQALESAVAARDARTPLAIGLLGNAASLVPQCYALEAPIDIVTDQCSAQNPLSYLPIGVEFYDQKSYAARKPDEFAGRAGASMARHVEAMVRFRVRGAEVFTFGNRIRAQALEAGYSHAFDIPGFIPAYLRPLQQSGRIPISWTALSGNADDIARADKAVTDLFPDDEPLTRWLRLAPDRVNPSGLPARVCWLGNDEHGQVGTTLNELVAQGEISAPIVISRELLPGDPEVAAQRSLLGAMKSIASGATWVCIQHSGLAGPAGLDRWIHSSLACLADGTDLAAQKLQRVLTSHLW